MNRRNNLFEQIISFDNLLLSARKARRGKRLRPDVFEFELLIEKNLIELKKEIEEKTYRPGEYREHYIRDPKVRKISAAPYRDRVVHHALVSVLEPIWERSFIFDSYACRKGKGTHAALKRIEPWLKSSRYVLHGDIKKYFPSIDHEILKKLIRRKIKCQDTLWLVDLIIDGSNPQDPVDDYFPGDNLFDPVFRSKGLPIGNQTSQFFSNVYLDPLDHFVKVGLGVKRYVRYCDDFLIFENDKKRLSEYRERISEFLGSLRLKLHENKSQAVPCVDGVTFLGFRCFSGYRKLRRGNGTRCRKRMSKMIDSYISGHGAADSVEQSWASWQGHAKWGKTFHLRRRFHNEFTRRLTGVQSEETAAG